MKLGLTTGALAAALVSGPTATPAPARDLGFQVELVAGRYHDRDRRDRDRRGYSRYAWQRGYERGADHGYDKGRGDARRHRGYDPWRHSRFRKATSGYKSRFGPRPAYRDGYREGFARAYERGFARSHHDHGRRDRCYDGRHRRW